MTQHSKVLDQLFTKNPNEIFAPHLLATRQQKLGETLVKFLQKLRTLSKDCNTKSVSAKQYREELIQDSFINGLLSPIICQDLLENSTLDLKSAFDQASASDLAQNAETYTMLTICTATAAAVPALVTEQTLRAPVPDDTSLAGTFIANRCYFCGNTIHNRKMALPEIVCVIIVGRRGIMQKFAGPRLQRLVHCFPPLLCATVASCPDSLKQASVKVSVGTKLTALVDSGSSNSYISERIAKYLNLVVHSSTEDVSMALNSLKSHIVGHCYVDITLNKNVYPSCRLGILTDLCSDIILGQDFQGKNKSVVIKYGGSKLELIITKLTPVCALSAVQLEELYLFCFIIMVFNSLFDYIPLISFEIHWFFFIL